VRVLGLDIGSRTVDAVWLADGGVLVDAAIADSGFDPAATARVFVERGAHDVIVATGYGRHAAREAFGCTAVTEIKAHALGASALFPQAAAVLDIGGQDTKVIALAPGGRVTDFEMNDKCAAGTGKFLEVMARALGYSLEEMARAALATDRRVAISSMCTVFAESEVTGLVHRGEDRPAIARGLYESIARRTQSALKRVGAASPLVFSGGVAKSPAMVVLIERGFGGEVLVAATGAESASIDPQTVGAYGAALSGLGAGSASAV
jgi:predicted CoA-substrate-specific enzyme activase